MTLLSVITDIIKKRPLMCLGISLFVLPFCIFEYLILFPLVYGAWSIGTGNIFEAAIYLIQIALGRLGSFRSQFPENLLTLFIMFVGTIFVAALAAGFFYITNGDVNDKRLNFMDGVKMYFSKINNVILTFFSACVVFFFFSIVVALPSLVLTRAINVEAMDGFLLKASLGLVDITTLLVLSYEVVLLLVYFSFWIAAIFCFDKGSFLMAKRIIYYNYWELMVKFLFFAFIVFGIEFLFVTVNIVFSKYAINNELGVLMFVFLNCIVKSFLFLSFITYVFKEFKDKKNEVYEQLYQEEAI